MKNDKERFPAFYQRVFKLIPVRSSPCFSQDVSLVSYFIILLNFSKSCSFPKYFIFIVFPGTNYDLSISGHVFIPLDCPSLTSPESRLFRVSYRLQATKCWGVMEEDLSKKVSVLKALPSLGKGK